MRVLSGGVTYILLNFLLMSLAVTGYRCRKGVLLFILPPALCLPAALFIFVFKIGVLPTLLSVSLFGYLFIGLVYYREDVELSKERYAAELDERARRIKEYSLNLENLYVAEDRTAEKELATVKLYEMTKKMSWALKLEEIVNILGGILRENFTFKRCEVLLLKELDGAMVRDKLYAIGWDKRLEPEKEQIDYERLLEMLGDTSGPLYFTGKTDLNVFAGLKIRNDVKTFTAIPLLSENKAIGVLAIQDMPYISLEMASIVSMQFALEIKRVMLYEKVEELAITDGLTGLYVRRYFLERFKEELNRSKRYGLKFAFLMIDIDDFKKVNDSYGHLVGDVVLKETARVVRGTVREIDLVSRYGGEEFCVLLPETSADGAKLVAERIRSRIEESSFKAYDEKLKMTVSIGLSLYPEDSLSSRGLIECADSALYVAKRSGKNLVCKYKK